MKRRKKTKDPAYMVRNSDLKNHIDRVIKSDDGVQRAIQEEVQRLLSLEEDEREVDMRAIFLLTLRRHSNLGRKRLLQYAKTLNEELKKYREKYEECDRYAMRIHLREEVGIDVEHLDEEVKKLAEEENTDSRST